jgi:hypothetical protein
MFTLTLLCAGDRRIRGTQFTSYTAAFNEGKNYVLAGACDDFIVTRTLRRTAMTFPLPTHPKPVSHAMPDWVKRPVETTELGWKLGYVVPNRYGYTPDAGFFADLDYNKALQHCKEDAKRWGISDEAYDATVISSVLAKNYDQALAVILKKRGKP